MKSLSTEYRRLIVAFVCLITGAAFGGLSYCYFIEWFPYSALMWFSSGPLMGYGLLLPTQGQRSGAVIGFLVQLLITALIVTDTLSGVGQIR
jgi:hypothetical protein